MHRFILILSFLVLPIFTLVLPIDTFAQNNSDNGNIVRSYQLLAPLPGLTEVEGSTGLSQYLNAMFRMGIGIAGLLAVVMIVICGIKFMTSEAVSSKSDAKSCIQNAVFGLLLALSSYLILRTINPQLLNSDITIVAQTSTQGASQQQSGSGTVQQAEPTEAGWWFQYTDQDGNRRFAGPQPTVEACAKQVDQFQKSGATINPRNGNNCFEIQRRQSQDQQQTDANEASARRRLCNNDLCVNSGSQTFNPAVNKGGCATDGATNCTRLAFLPSTSIDFIRSLVGSCGNCQIVVTGGTENGHATHGKNQNVFDLRYLYNDGLDRLIRANGEDGHGNRVPNGISTCGSGGGFCSNRRWKYGDFWFIDEISAAQKGGIRHWHVCRDGQTNAAGTVYPYCTRPPRPAVNPSPNPSPNPTPNPSPSPVGP